MIHQLDVDEHIDDICTYYQVREDLLRAFLKGVKFPDNFVELFVKGTPNYVLPLYNEYYLSHLTGMLETVGLIDFKFKEAPHGDLHGEAVISIYDRDLHAYQDLFKTFENRQDIEKSCITGIDALGFLGLLAPYFTRFKPQVMTILYGPDYFAGKPGIHFSHLKIKAICRKIEDMFSSDFFSETEFINKRGYPDFNTRLLTKSSLVEDLHTVDGVGMFPDMVPRNATKFEYIRAIAAQISFGLQLTNGDERKSIIGLLWGFDNLVTAISIHEGKFIETVPSRIKRQVTDIFKFM